MGKREDTLQRQALHNDLTTGLNPGTAESKVGGIWLLSSVHRERDDNMTALALGISILTSNRLGDLETGNNLSIIAGVVMARYNQSLLMALSTLIRSNLYSSGLWGIRSLIYKHSFSQ